MIHVIQCDPEVPPGTVADGLEALSAAWRLVRLDRGEPLPLEPEALIVLGGTMSVHDEKTFPFLKELKECIRECVQQGSPYLGICLGGQLLAAALGAPVIRNRWQEVGTCTVSLTEQGIADRLFRDTGPCLSTFQWHNDSFNLPAGGVLLASSSTCPHQAFRIGAHAWGLQFHPEVTPSIITAWSTAEGHPEQVTRRLVSDWEQNEQHHRQLMQCILQNLMGVDHGQT